MDGFWRVGHACKKCRSCPTYTAMFVGGGQAGHLLRPPGGLAAGFLLAAEQAAQGIPEGGLLALRGAPAALARVAGGSADLGVAECSGRVGPVL